MNTNAASSFAYHTPTPVLLLHVVQNEEHRRRGKKQRYIFTSGSIMACKNVWSLTYGRDMHGWKHNIRRKNTGFDEIMKIYVEVERMMECWMVEEEKRNTCEMT